MPERSPCNTLPPSKLEVLVQQATCGCSDNQPGLNGRRSVRVISTGCEQDVRQHFTYERAQWIVSTHHNRSRLHSVSCFCETHTSLGCDTWICSLTFWCFASHSRTSKVAIVSIAERRSLATCYLFRSGS
eukprot:9004693-Pyramimonas_sp.AAC.1